MAAKDWTAEDIPDLTGRIAVVTGASAGADAQRAALVVVESNRG